MAAMTQQQLEALKEQASKIGRWAEYYLTEIEYWNPLQLPEITEEKLREKEQECRDWLSENQAYYPDSGATEQLRSDLTEEVKANPWALDDDVASEMESHRLDGAPIEELLQDLELQKEEGVYPMREDNLDLNEIIEKAITGQELLPAEREYLENHLPSELLRGL